MNIELQPQMKDKLFPDNTVLIGYRGSVAHHMYIENTEPNSTDDIDLMGVFMAPIDHYIGIKKVKETDEKFIDEWDVVSYEFIKFVKLLCKSNPNVMSLLWIKPEHYVTLNTYGKMLIDNRDLFVSSIAYRSYVGYAHDQLDKMEKHNRKGYMGAKRKALVEKYGIDTKNASHCIRLLRMGIEFLNDGKLNVFREDPAELLDIKNGKWSIDEVKDEAERLFVLAKEAHLKTDLPEEPDITKINALVKAALSDYINKKTI